jgi:antitoxin VapB
METRMGMSIKNSDVERLAKELAAETGESLTAAIKIAIEERLERLRHRREVAEKKRRLREILDSLPPPPPGVTSDHSDLYDEYGLPK